MFIMTLHYIYKTHEEEWEERKKAYTIVFPLTLSEVRDAVKDKLTHFKRLTVRLEESKERLKKLAFTEASVASEADELEYKYLKEFGADEKESYLREEIGWCKEFLKRCKVI